MNLFSQKSCTMQLECHQWKWPIAINNDNIYFIISKGLSKNIIEFVKNQKKKYVIQMSKHIFQICIDWILHNDIFLKVIFSLCSNCEIMWNYLLCCFAFAELNCFCVLPTLMCLLPYIYFITGFLQMKTQLNLKLQMNYLQKDNWVHLPNRWHANKLSYRVLHLRR